MGDIFGDMSAFARLSHAIARRPKTVLLSWGFVAFGLYAMAFLGVPGQGSLEDRTSTGPPEAKNSDSYVVRHTFLDTAPADADVTVAGQFLGSDPTDLETMYIVSAGMDAIAQIDGVRVVTSPFYAAPGPDFDPTAVGSDADPRILVTNGEAGFLVIVALSPLEDDNAELALHEEIEGALTEVHAELMSALAGPQANSAGMGAPELHVFSVPLFFDSFDKQLQKDLITGEMIAIPLALIVMVFVFGGFLAILMTSLQVLFNIS